MVADGRRGSFIVLGSTTALSIGAFSDFVSFSTRIKILGLFGWQAHCDKLLQESIVPA